MTEHRMKFSPQHKAQAVQMVIETGKPIAEVARDLGIHDGTLARVKCAVANKASRDTARRVTAARRHQAEAGQYSAAGPGSRNCALRSAPPRAG